jgi:small-conductance mechanosensitive channel
MPNALTDLLNRLLNFLGNAGWAALVAVILLWLTKRLRARTRGVIRNRGGDQNTVTVFDNLMRIGVYLLIGLIVVVTLSGGDTASLVTSIGLITAAVSLALQDVLRNFVSGLYLLIERPFLVGDAIRVADQRGTVERVDIRTTVIRDARLDEVFVPNFIVFSQVVRRKSGLASNHFSISSPYPIDRSFAAIRDAAQRVQTASDAPPTVAITGADAETVDFDIVVWDTIGSDSSDAFIAAVRSDLENATIKKVAD